MRPLLWAIAGGTLAGAIYLILNAPEPSYSSGDVERAANKTDVWGTKQRLTGSGGSIAGKVKETFGNATGNDQLAGEGVADQAVGQVKDAAGKVAGAVSDTLRDFNRT